MPSQQERDQERDSRLQEWFKSSSGGYPQEWEDIKDVIEVCIGNADMQLKSVGCKVRDFHAGECVMGKSIIASIESYKNAKEETPPST